MIYAVVNMVTDDSAVRNRRNTWISNSGARATVVPAMTCIAIAARRTFLGLNL
jgi:hypothetical protein